ncbi:Leu/Ile/Val/Thr-binding protein [Striga asiatica]|uniref:Leu/Ile/Val/Thr-binding protein n=1 Tax=Striga asiatica TaxID=4170 RepID=A0A5A7R144_STRAF|nr:Leu/Ile/Val/Thr-binding protein [Striga asiatica]
MTLSTSSSILCLTPSGGDLSRPSTCTQVPRARPVVDLEKCKPALVRLAPCLHPTADPDLLTGQPGALVGSAQNGLDWDTLGELRLLDGVAQGEPVQRRRRGVRRHFVPPLGWGRRWTVELLRLNPKMIFGEMTEFSN